MSQPRKQLARLALARLVLATFVLAVQRGAGAAPPTAAGRPAPADATPQVVVDEPADAPRNAGVGKALRGMVSRLWARGGGAELAPIPPLLGRAAPDFDLATPQGGSLSLASLRGKVVVLGFWAGWSAPSVRTLAELESLHLQHGAERLAVVGVNLDDDPADVAKTLREQGCTFAQVLDADGQAARSYEVSSVPQLVLIDAAGVVQAVEEGAGAGLATRVGNQIARLMAGNTLFDQEAVARAGRRRAARVAELKAQLSEFGVERVQVVADIPTRVAASLPGQQPPRCFRLRGVAGETLAIAGGANTVLVVTLTQGERRAKAIRLRFANALDLYEFTPLPGQDQAGLAALGCRYDDNYNMQQLAVSAFDPRGVPRWTAGVPIAGAYDPDPALAAADLTGDGWCEVAVLTEYFELPPGLAPDGAHRVLTVYDRMGELLTRMWVPGRGGIGLHVAPTNEGPGLMFSTGTTLRIIRLGRPGRGE